MSRIGKKPIALPKGVTVKVNPDGEETFDAGGQFATVEIANVRRRVNVDLLREDGLEEGDGFVGVEGRDVGDVDDRIHALQRLRSRLSIR